MNTEVTTEFTPSINHSTISSDITKYYAEKLYKEVDPVMKQVYFNTLIRLLDGKQTIDGSQ